MQYLKSPPLALAVCPLINGWEKISYSIYFSASPDKLTFMWRSTYLINKALPANGMLTNILKSPLWTCPNFVQPTPTSPNSSPKPSLGFSVGLIKIISICRSAANVCGISVCARAGGWNGSHNKDRVSWELPSWVWLCCATRIYGTGASESTLYWLN